MKRHPLKPVELLTAIAVLAMFAACGIVYAASELLSSESCYDNVYIDGKPVGGLTEAQIRETFRGADGAVAPKDLTVIVGDNRWIIPMKDINARYDIVGTQRAAMAVGRQGDALQRLNTLFRLRVQPQHFQFQLQYDRDALKEHVERIYNDVLVRPQDAKMEFRPQAEQPFVLTNEVAGLSIDDTALLSVLQERLHAGNFSAVTVSAQRREAAVTGESLRRNVQLIASYTTELTDDAQRNQNIALACDAINGMVLQDDAEFSFNQATGERSSQKGYVDAPMIANKQLVDGPGGGVCQVSTTLYNAVAIAGLNILERHHHSWPVFYAPAGLDSTVDYGRKDLRFQNGTGAPLYIVARANLEARTVVVSLYGVPAESTIDLDVQTLETIQPDRAKEIANNKKYVGYREVVTEERDGYRVKVYRVHLSGGQEQRRELLSEDYYAPVQGVVEVGTRKRSGGDPGGKK